MTQSKRNDNYWRPIPNNPRDNKLYIDKKAKGEEGKFNRDMMLFDDEDGKDNYGKTKSEIYGGRYGYRQTASGGWRERDEPDAETQYRQSDAINRLLQKKRAAASRERLKQANKVPTKAGKKLFEEFLREAYKVEASNKSRKALDDDDMENIYNAATQLSFPEWIWFVVNEYGGGI